MGAVPSDGAHPKVRAAGLVVERVEGEVLVYDRERDKAHRLNETAALVFDHCDGDCDVQELAARLSAQTGRPIGEDIVERALIRLGDEHLLEDPVSTRPGSRDWSRRKMVRKVAMTTAAAVALPAVTSIVAPAAAQVASCAPPGGPCGSSFGGGCEQLFNCCSGSCLPPAVGAVCVCQ